jgi:hypothetical protein
MAITFGSIITENTKNSANFSDNHKLKAARDFIAEQIDSLKKLDFRQVFPGEKTYKKGVSGDGFVYSASNQKDSYGFYIKHDLATNEKILTIVKEDQHDNMSAGGYTNILESKGTWRQIYNDMRSLKPEMVNSDPLDQVDFRNVFMIAGSFAKFRDHVNQAASKLSDFDSSTARPVLKEAIMHLEKALTTFGKISEKAPGQILVQNDKLTFTGNQNISQIYGNPKVDAIKDTVQGIKGNNYYIKLEEGHNIDGVTNLLKQFGKIKETLAEHVDANKNVLGTAAKNNLART